MTHPQRRPYEGGAQGCELFCSDAARKKAQPDNNRNAIAKRSVVQFNLLNRHPSGCPSPRSEKCRAKGNTMQVPSILQGESLKRLLQGAAAGAVATIFGWLLLGGWSLGSTADKMAQERSELAVIAALAPVCAD